MKMYRVMRFLHERNIPLLPGIISRVIRVVFACDLPSSCDLAKGVVLKHNGLGVVIVSDTVIGENTQVFQNVTIGGRHNRGVPTIGKNVFIGAGACVLGGVSIGDNVEIGANSVVISDLPRNSVAVGIPARIIKIKS